MNFRTAGVCLGAWLAMCPAIPAQAPHVTDTKWVSTGGGKKELLRKINGRWWSPDNREVYPPSKGGVFWVYDSEPGVCQFFHHRPLLLDRAETLRLWMTKQEVEAALGQPNRIFGTGDHAFWYYYAANGIKLQVRFMDDGVLGEAKYYAIGEKSWSVASIEREMNGRDIYKLLQERATQRSKEWLAKETQENRADQAARSEALRRSMGQAGAPRPGSVQPRVLTVAPATAPETAEPPLPPQKRIVSAKALAAIAPGAAREDVLKKLGEPRSRYSITDDEGTQESFTYDLDSGESAVIHLLNGKVDKVRRQ